MTIIGPTNIVVRKQEAAQTYMVIRMQGPDKHGDQEADGPTCAEQDVEGRGVPGEDPHPLTVALQGHQGLRHRPRQAPVWYLPHLGTTQRQTSNHVTLTTTESFTR